MGEMITYKNYNEYKAELDTELSKSAEGFVRIGYLLKLARDTDILKESGYLNVEEFARAEYGIDKTMVSRFIRINDRFSEGGNSPVLKEQYRNFGYSKLAIMLQLPDGINEELSPAFSKSEILAVKEEYDEEMKKTDLEILMEEKQEMPQDMEDLLSKAVWQLGHDNKELYVEIYEAVKAGTLEALQEAMAPAGEGIHSVRIPGEGRFMVSVKGTDSSITITNIRTGEKKGYGWELFHKTACRIVRLDMYTPEKSWERVYGESFPKEQESEKPGVASVQQENPDKKTVKKKKPKVTKAKTEEKPVDTRSEEPEVRAGETRQTEVDKNEEVIENVTGISEIVTEGPETVTEIPETVTEEPAEIPEQNTDISEGSGNIVGMPHPEPDVQEDAGSSPDAYKPQLTKEEYRTRREACISYIKEQMVYIQQDMEDELWNMVKDAMENGLNRINELIRLDNDHEEYLDELEREEKDEIDREENADE